MEEYLIPAKASESEFTEKRSRFLSHLWPVESETEAREHIEAVKKRYHDARHNCWCYILREGGVLRYSDDGEPQGTAGQPMLSVFQKEQIENVCCVVTRYFGGVLLGAGGLARAYGKSAKDALDAAGVAVVRPWTVVECECPYGLFERLRQELPPLFGAEGEHDFGTAITFRALLPQGREEDFARRAGELSAGEVIPRVTGTQWRAVPRRGGSA